MLDLGKLGLVVAFESECACFFRNNHHLSSFTVGTILGAYIWYTIFSNKAIVSLLGIALTPRAEKPLMTSSSASMKVSCADKKTLLYKEFFFFFQLGHSSEKPKHILVFRTQFLHSSEEKEKRKMKEMVSARIELATFCDRVPPVQSSNDCEPQRKHPETHCTCVTSSYSRTSKKNANI